MCSCESAIDTIIWTCVIVENIPTNDVSSDNARAKYRMIYELVLSAECTFTKHINLYNKYAYTDTLSSFCDCIYIVSLKTATISDIHESVGDICVHPLREAGFQNILVMLIVSAIYKSISSEYVDRNQSSNDAYLICLFIISSCVSILIIINSRYVILYKESTAASGTETL